MAYSDRYIGFMEGFGYNTTQLRTLYPFGSNTATVDESITLDRNALSLPPGDNIILQLPRYDSSNWSWQIGYNGNAVTIVQAKIYFEQATMQNVSELSKLIEVISGNDYYVTVGIQPNSATAQDNWFLSFIHANAANPTDYAVNDTYYVGPAILPQTLHDVKFIIYQSGANYTRYLYIDNKLVCSAGAGYTDNWHGAYFKGVKLWGMKSQTTNTLWSDVIVYSFSSLGESGLTIGQTTLEGRDLIPISARVYDCTPVTTLNGINEFATVGAGTPITALSSIDTGSYVASTGGSQSFRLKPAGIGGGLVLDSNEVIAVSQLITAKDTVGAVNNFKFSISDPSLTDYRYRYMKIVAFDKGGGTSENLRRVRFFDPSNVLLSVPVGSTMRLNKCNDTVAVEIAADTAVNTTVHTAKLFGDSDSSIYGDVLRFTGEDIRIKDRYAEYIIDFGVGNEAPDWYSMDLVYSNTTDYYGWVGYMSMSVYGSNDNSTWYLLGSIANGGNGVSPLGIINRRHASHPDQAYRDKAKFTLNAGAFDKYYTIWSGDPMAADTNSRAPIPYRQFKEYLIGFEEE